MRIIDGERIVQPRRARMIALTSKRYGVGGLAFQVLSEISAENDQHIGIEKVFALIQLSRADT